MKVKPYRNQLLSSLVIAQELCHLGLLEFQRDSQRCFAVIVLRVYVRSVVEQQFSEFQLAAAGGFVQRTTSLFAAAVHIRAASDQEPSQIDLFHRGRAL